MGRMALGSTCRVRARCRYGRSDEPSAPFEGLEQISREECLHLLATLSVGRVAVPTAQGSPLVVPVNYLLDGEVVVFRTDPGSKLYGLRQHPVSFQVDSIDPFRRTGWSVLVQGVAYDATPVEVEHLTVEPWTGGEKQHWVRLVPLEVSGRRIRLPEIKLDQRGYL